MLRIAIAILFVILPSGVVAENVVPGKLVPKVQAKSGFSYALYLPSGYNANKQWPVIFVLDPLARGTLAAEGFVPGAERYGYIVAASNDSRNGPLRSEAIGAMWDDVRNRFPVDPKRLYLAGMSGGARAAITVAERCESCAVAGVILCAAGFADPRYSPSKRLIFYGLAGIYDFNYPELQLTMEKLQSLQITHRFQTWEGTHEWAPAPVLEDALAWFRLQEMLRGTLQRDTAFLDAFYDREMKNAGELAASGKSYQAFLAYKQIVADFAPLRDVTEPKKKIETLASSKEMKDGTRNEQRITEWQSSYEEPALRAIAQIAGGSPSPEIRASGIQAASDLSSRLAREKDPARVIAMKRALGSITIGSYEAAGKTRQDKNYSGTSALYEIIVAAQPGNPVALYNAACGFALLGDKKKALRTLEKAIASGFRDVETINRDNDLESLRSDPEFEKLVKTIPR